MSLFVVLLQEIPAKLASAAHSVRLRFSTTSLSTCMSLFVVLLQEIPAKLASAAHFVRLRCSKNSPNYLLCLRFSVLLCLELYSHLPALQGYLQL